MYTRLTDLLVADRGHPGVPVRELLKVTTRGAHRRPAVGTPVLHAGVSHRRRGHHGLDACMAEPVQHTE